MKKIIILLLSVASLQSAFSQTATSVQNGAWLSPSTWDCSCIPVMNYSVVINHTVTLNTSMSFTSATSGLNIGANGALLQDANRDILINGGNFTNNGKFNARFFYTESISSDGMNVGTATLSAFTNSGAGIFHNYGTIIVDSITNTSGFQNLGLLQADSLTNTSTANLLNDGTMSLQWSRNYGIFQNKSHMDGIAHTNNGTFINVSSVGGYNDSLLLSAGLWNIGNFTNQSDAYIRLGNGFYNYNPSTHKAVFQNDGKVIVLDSWYNTDTVKGGGCFTVQDSSVNSGYMKGNFSFVDNTPLGAIVDYNLGSISSGINTSACTVGIEKFSNENEFSIYPNPTTSTLNINVSSSSAAYRELTVYDVLGNTINIPLAPFKGGNTSIDVSSLPSGMYYLKVGGTSQKFVRE